MIRQATPDEAEAVAQVQVRTWQTAYANVLPEEGLRALSVADRAEAWRGTPPLVAEVDGQIVGFVSVGRSRDADGDGELYAIYVLPEHWGAGVGRALIEAGEAKLRELGHGRGSLWVLDDNPQARRFYEAAGWSLDGAARRIGVFGFEVDEVRYRKDL